MRFIRQFAKAYLPQYFILFTSLLFFVPGHVLSQSEPTQAENTVKYEKELQKRDQAIELLQKRLDMLEQEVRTLRAASAVKPAAPAAAPAAAQKTAEQKPGYEATAAVAGRPPTPEEKEDEERLAKSALEQLLVQRNVVLLPSGTLEIEPSLTYAHSSADRIVINGVAIIDPLGLGIVIGDIVNEKNRHDSLIPTLTLRAGLPWDSQVEARVPFRYNYERIVTADFSERTREAAGIGDVEFALSRQLIQEKGWLPDLVGSARWRAPTGETEAPAVGLGYNGLQFLVTGVKTRDPVAFFGGLSYTLNFPAQVNDVDLDPGDIFGFNLGAAVALSPETSINFQWEQRFFERSIIDGFNVAGSALRVGIFKVGFTYTLSKNYFLDMGVGIGVTQDAPDVQATVAIPIRMPRFFNWID